MPTTFGSNTPPSVWVKSTSHQITEEFVVKAANTIYKGQPVKLDPAGTIIPFVAADDDSLRIGTSLHDAAAGEKATIILNGHTIVLAIADGATAAGPVKYTSYDTATGRPKYSDAAVTPAITSGWALDNVADLAEMRVLTRN